MYNWILSIHLLCLSNQGSNDYFKLKSNSSAPLEPLDFDNPTFEPEDLRRVNPLYTNGFDELGKKNTANDVPYHFYHSIDERREEPPRTIKEFPRGKSRPYELEDEPKPSSNTRRRCIIIIVVILVIAAIAGAVAAALVLTVFKNGKLYCFDFCFVTIPKYLSVNKGKNKLKLILNFFIA